MSKNCAKRNLNIRMETRITFYALTNALLLYTLTLTNTKAYSVVLGLDPFCKFLF